MMTCTKKYSDFPFAHRQHNHSGHCALIHGHNWSFEFDFTCLEPDANGFVIDFGELKWLKDWLAQLFDHTLVLNKNDPFLELLKETLEEVRFDGNSPNSVDFAKIIVVPNASCEGLAHWLFNEINAAFDPGPGCRLSDDDAQRGIICTKVTVYEDSKNSASYE